MLPNIQKFYYTDPDCKSHRYMAEILPIRRKTLTNQLLNQADCKSNQVLTLGMRHLDSNNCYTMLYHKREPKNNRTKYIYISNTKIYNINDSIGIIAL